VKIPLKTVQKYTEIKLSQEELIERIEQTLGDVEEIEDLGKKYKGILVAQIKEVSPHPEADKLAIYKIDIGASELVQVVAGDKTLQPGDKVAYFPVDTLIPFNAHPEKHGNIVEKAKLRGVESEGMMASARELDISADHEKVLRLDDELGRNAKPGDLFAEVYGLNDVIIDLENKAMTNRPECFGLIGLSREISAIQGLKFNTPEWFDYGYNGDLDSTAFKNASTANKSINLIVENEVPDYVRRYVAVAMGNVTLKSSPVWLQIELMKVGIRPINNVVDITNYLMMMTGQPIHAFDMDKLVSRDTNVKQGEVKIVTRLSKKGERIVAIDGKSVELDGEIVVIADSNSPVAIAGVMGGLDTEIDENTKNVIIEVANFEMCNIRRTANKTGIFSEAFTRFSKNQDPQMCLPVMSKAIEMMTELADAPAISQTVDNYPRPRSVRNLEVSVEGIRKNLGFEIPVDEITKIFTNVELDYKQDGDKLSLRIPTYRQDLNIPEDVYEEVSRIYGFGKIPLNLPPRSTKPIKRNMLLDLQDNIRENLAASGAYELITYNFVGKDLLEKCNQDVSQAFHIKNAVSPELAYMRMNLTPSLLEKVVLNHEQGYDELAFFEINKSHIKNVIDNENLPFEFRTTAFVFSASDKVSKKYDGAPYYMAKKYVDELLKSLRCKNVRYEVPEGSKMKEYPVWLRNALFFYAKGQLAIVTYQFEGKKYYLGVVGSICPNIRSRMKLPKYIAGFELDIYELQKITDLEVSYIEPSNYPKAIQDLCFVVDKDVPYIAVEDAIKSELNEHDDMVFEIEPIDIYESKVSIEKSLDGQNTKQVTVRLYLQDRTKVLSDKDVDFWRKRVIRGVKQFCGGVLKE